MLRSQWSRIIPLGVISVLSRTCFPENIRRVFVFNLPPPHPRWKFRFWFILSFKSFHVLAFPLGISNKHPLWEGMDIFWSHMLHVYLTLTCVQLGYCSKKNYWDVKYLGEKTGIQVFRMNTLQITGIQSTKVMFWMIKIMNVEYSGHRIMGYGILRPLLKGSPDLPLPGETNPDHLINLKIQPLDSYLVAWFQIKYFLHYIPWKCYWVIIFTWRTAFHVLCISTMSLWLLYIHQEIIK